MSKWIDEQIKFEVTSAHAVMVSDKPLLLLMPADISLGHEHDLRVKHLSDTLADKYGPVAGKYHVTS